MSISVFLYQFVFTINSNDWLTTKRFVFILCDTLLNKYLRMTNQCTFPLIKNTLTARKTQQLKECKIKGRNKYKQIMLGQMVRCVSLRQVLKTKKPFVQSSTSFWLLVDTWNCQTIRRARSSFRSVSNVFESYSILRFSRVSRFSLIWCSNEFQNKQLQRKWILSYGIKWMKMSRIRYWIWFKWFFFI